MKKEPVKLTKQEFLDDLVQEEWKHYRNQIYGNDEMEVRYSFTNQRINQKLMQLYLRYEDIHLMDYNTMFEEMVELIIQVVHGMKDKYITIAHQKTRNKQGKLAYHDSISYIITTVEQRIYDKVNDLTGAYRDRSKENMERIANLDDEDYNGDIVSVGLPVFLDEVLYADEDGRDITSHDLISGKDIIRKQYKDDYIVDQALQKIYADAKLTARQIEVLEALEMTPDNFNNREIYTKTMASQILGTSEENIRKTFHVIKNKILNTYGEQVPILTDTRQNLIKKLDSFLDNIESEKDIINFIKENLEEEFILYLLYDSKLDAGLRRYFNKNKDNDEELHSDTMRKFCTYFIRELYSYIDLLRHNDSMTQPIALPRKERETQGKNKPVNGEITKYIREDKATQQQKLNDYIIIDKEKYYKVVKNIENLIQ